MNHVARYFFPTTGVVGSPEYPMEYCILYLILAIVQRI